VSHAARPVRLLPDVDGRHEIRAVRALCCKVDCADVVGAWCRRTGAVGGSVTRVGGGLGGGRGRTLVGNVVFECFALFFMLRSFFAGEIPLGECVRCELLGVAKLGGLGHVRLSHRVRRRVESR